MIVDIAFKYAFEEKQMFPESIVVHGVLGQNSPRVKSLLFMLPVVFLGIVHF